ncbi:interstitial collagenase-like isoform X2 [Paramacrobiotus metropolitanus]|uniref:interstitial collagenase-like isoform X2 n=1 Tax=Paramacrobiotus metropolitanus TaxID=2943436 RepID=UPI002445909E|nr:interstitial collagenase-like isoform X2 [Paramacrobiotus metropolitanus]
MTRIYFHVLFMVCVVIRESVVHSAPLPTGAASTQSFLQKYGYLHKGHPEMGRLVHRSHVETAIRKYQAFMKLPVTGVIDDATAKMMATPRCGVPDVFADEQVARAKRYAFSQRGGRWRNRHLTWTVSKMTNQLYRFQVEAEVDKALQVWSDHTNFVFTKASRGSKGDIDIRFEEGNHHDDNPFDSITLAHAFFPHADKRGQVHFNDDTSWKTAYGDTHFRYVAAHEFGHTLGLDHSDYENSLMFPHYPGYRAEFEYLTLHEDDIAGIQALYRDPYKPATTTRNPFYGIFDKDFSLPFDFDEDDTVLDDGSDGVFTNSFYGLDDRPFDLKTDNGTHSKSRPIKRKPVIAKQSRSDCDRPSASAFLLIIGFLLVCTQ